MRVKNFSFESPQDNILYDELLLQLAEKKDQGEVLRFWESSKIFIVLGLVGNQHEDVYLNQAKIDQIPVLRRTSGGGTVIQGPGCMNFSLVLSKKRHPDIDDLRRSYAWISQKIIISLQVNGIQAVFKPISDIALAENEMKFSGNAQHRGKNYILHHGTILYNFDLVLLSRYLQIPKQVPDYRQNRPHSDFVTNIPIDPNRFQNDLIQAFGATEDENSQTISSEEFLALEKLSQTRQVVINF